MLPLKTLNFTFIRFTELEKYMENAMGHSIIFVLFFRNFFIVQSFFYTKGSEEERISLMKTIHQTC